MDHSVFLPMDHYLAVKLHIQVNCHSNVITDLSGEDQNREDAHLKGPGVEAQLPVKVLS